MAFIAVFFVALGIALLIFLVLLGVGLGAGYLLHWLLPAIDLGAAVIIGVLTTSVTAYFVTHLIGLIGASTPVYSKVEDEPDSSAFYVIDPITQGRSRRHKQPKPRV